MEGPGSARRHPLGELGTSIAGPWARPRSSRIEGTSTRAVSRPARWWGSTVSSGCWRPRPPAPPAACCWPVAAGSRPPSPARRSRCARPSTWTSRGRRWTALAGRFGGIAALDPRNGEVRALAGIAFSAPQPPGSTFKIVTAVAALERKLVTPRTPFPVETARGHRRRGARERERRVVRRVVRRLVRPLVQLRVRAAGRHAWAPSGWWPRPSASASTGSPRSPARRPARSPQEFTGPLDLGSSAIGQGRVLATPLMMASLSQVIAADGVRYEPTLLSERRPRRRARHVAQGGATWSSS